MQTCPVTGNKNNIAANANNISGRTLYNKYQELKNNNAKLRAREAAEILGVSEGELLASRVGIDATRLVDDAWAILESLEPLGELMALSRNEFCVHERKGVYTNSSVEEHGKMRVGLFVNADVDLRLFLNSWKYCFAAVEQTRGGALNSFQFFDISGVAVHKVYLTENSVKEKYQEIVDKFKAENQYDFIEISAKRPKQEDLSDDVIDVETLRRTWRELKDTHDFYPMIARLKVGRQQAHRLAGEEFAYKVSNQAFRQTLEKARDKKCEIMAFVGNPGIVQIHTGPVEKLFEYGSWFNVMDEKFNLHMDESKIENIWVTKKPTVDGVVTAVEVFDVNGDLAVTLFGKRKPGIPELELWREIVNELSHS